MAGSFKTLYLSDEYPHICLQWLHRLHSDGKFGFCLCKSRSYITDRPQLRTDNLTIIMKAERTSMLMPW